MHSLEEIKRFNALAVAAVRKRRIAAVREWLGIRLEFERPLTRGDNLGPSGPKQNQKGGQKP